MHGLLCCRVACCHRSESGWTTTCCAHVRSPVLHATCQASVQTGVFPIQLPCGKTAPRSLYGPFQGIGPRTS